MSKRPSSWFVLVFALLECVVRTHLTVYDSSHGFMPNNHDRYIMEDISSMHEELTSDIRNSSIGNLNLYIKFEPEYLDFKQRPLGVPHVEKVRLFNTDKNRSIDMTSISGSTVHFHSSFFEDKKIPPLGNTTFNVVFLGREEGTIESSLFIHTTEGHLKYHVKGASVYSPYRLRPIVGIKLPVNTSFSPLIYMHNPHMEPIQIIEVYSSGGDFHLELPSGELEGPKDLWEIPPFETKAVIRVKFHAKTEQNHTAYVRIKLNNTEEVLVVPLEVEVTSTAGLFDPQGAIDFGVGGSLDPPKQVKLFLQNAHKKLVKITGIFTTSKAIKVSFESAKIPVDQKVSKHDGVFYQVATLTLDWKTAYKTKDFSGKIIIKYKNCKTRTEIPYYVTVVQGGLSYNSSVTKYFINENAETVQIRSMIVRNDFPTSVMLINVSLPEDAQSYFHILNFTSVILNPKEEKSIFSMKLKPGVSVSDLKLSSYVLLKTNVSEVEFPLLTYNGKLELHLPYKSKDNSLDLGLISVESKKETYILLLNRNPVSVTIKQMGTSLPASSVELIGCDRGSHVNALLQDSFKNMTKCVHLKSHEFAILRLTLKTHRSEGQVWGDVFVYTEYEQLSIPVHFKIAQGKLEIGPDRLSFDQCFPGKICSHPLKVHSTFNEPMMIEQIFSIPPDPRFSSKHSGHIMARATKIIGHLYLDPTLECRNECYLGLQQENTAQWLKTLSLTKQSSEFDINLVNTFYNRYLNLTANGQPRWQNITVRLDTSEVKGHLFKSRVKMSWPSLLADRHGENRSVFVFPLTQVGNVTYQELTLKNPSSHNLVVQLVLDYFYPGVDLLQESLPPNFIPSYMETNKKYKPEFFFRKMCKIEIGHTQKALGTKLHNDTLVIILMPGENFTLTLGYRANDAVADSAFIFLRNNLTVLEVIQLKAQGAQPNFKFGNRKPGSSQPLQFELTEKHLKDCEREKSRKYPTPNLTVKRSFTARNTGDVTVYVNNFYINGIPCEGYGFKVLNCEAFALPPNATKKIDIAFTPDFTLSKVTRTLILETSLNHPVNYTLMTTIPHYYLALCTSVLNRPNWENYLYYLAVCVKCFSLMFVVVTSVLESERIVKIALNVVTRQNPSTQPTLDLRLIGAQTRSEIRSQKSEENGEHKTKLPDKPVIKQPLEESKTPKVEPDKYTVLIPTTGKAKKRLGKKLSNEMLSDSSETKKLLIDKPVNKTKQPDVKAQTVEVDNNNLRKSASKEKRIQNKKQDTKQAEACEEETSSTTTESSNNDEVEKLVKVPMKKCSTKNEAVQKHDERGVNMNSKVERKKLFQKQNRNKDNVHENKNENQKEYRLKSHKNMKDRKEKQQSNKRLSADKVANKSYLDNIQNNNSGNVRTSPSTTNMWNENRATFSDVVARSDHHTVTPRTVQPQTSKPTMYVEPYKQNNTELGPIGSRKENYWQENNHTIPPPQPPPLHEEQYNQITSNSFFTEAHNLAVESSNAFLDFNSADNWQQRNTSSIMNLIHPNPLCSGSQINNVVPIQDPWNPTTTPNNYWDNILYSPMNENMQGHLSQGTWCSWGSSVWQPLSPEVTRTPTRTPPGFAPHRDMEERLQQQQQQTIYSPFDMSNIWAHQQSNPWNYPQGQ